jgi:hypothetical protein
MQPASPEALYLAYRLAVIDKDVSFAEQVLEKLWLCRFAGGSIPLSSYEVEKIYDQMRYWNPVFSIAEGEFPLKVDLVLSAATGMGADPLVLRMIGRPMRLDESDSLASNSASMLAQAQRIGDVEGVVVNEDQNLHFCITNEQAVGTQDSYIYYVEIDPVGRLTFGPLWPSQGRRGSVLTPQTRSISFPFRQTGIFGLSAVRLITSPLPVEVLQSPPDVNTRNFWEFYFQDMKEMIGSMKKLDLFYLMKRGDLY